MIIFDVEMRIARVLIMLLVLFALSSSYTLEGQWELTASYLSFTKTNPNVKFRFVNFIVTRALQPSQDFLGGPTITHTQRSTQQLTVYACATLTYNYYIKESSIYFQKVRASGSNRACLSN